MIKLGVAVASQIYDRDQWWFINRGEYPLLYLKHAVTKIGNFSTKIVTTAY